MAANLSGVLIENTRECVKQSKILVVGAGGIGCELLKNLVLTGFNDITVIDLDTIDVSNLNRQFLFRKEHVGKSKAKVAMESTLKFNPNVKIQAFHDSIMSTEYGLNFFKQFSAVMNALDNRAARNHVNRMCLSADVPLIESGTAGYLGQVQVIKKGLTECYECQPKPTQKTFPGCTIRNTPSEPVHCVVWAKHLFNQLFGEDDPDQDVSPDTEDPELAGDAGKSAMEKEASETAVGGIERKSTRTWATGTAYNPHKLFNKFFKDDIKYLLSMENLWKKRRPPTPLEYSDLPKDTKSETGMRDQRVWSIQECSDVFSTCLSKLRDQVHQQGDGVLVWDKDDEIAMDFVTSTANIRAYIFGIALKSRFDIKSTAGNIIPAIATTNAIIAALIVMEGIKVLHGDFDKCKQIYLNRQANPRKKLLVPCALDKPNPKCYVCSSKPEVTVVLNTEKFTVKQLEDKVLKVGLGMVAPDVEIDDGKGTILISSEEGETEENAEKHLSNFKITSGTILKCDDFLQNYNLNVIIAHKDKLEEEKEFVIVGDLSELKATAETPNGVNGGQEENKQEDEDDDLMVVEDPVEEPVVEQRKRKADDSDIEENKAKRMKLTSIPEESEDDVVIL
ncbi:SUMO-activating enzyme subunit 2-like isoform X1 [Mytilus edulis]|uniref:SUMO-activating enzyme subunit 2-like isoform X1 n=1 Tax=Mytilus edulis TaxID=6550 RepID=UPI0039F034B0